MEKTGLIDKIDHAFLLEKGFTEAVDKTPEARRRAKLRASLLQDLKDVGQNGDLSLILATERRFLENDLQQYANSPAMRDSLTAALAEMKAADRLLGKVSDPGAYRQVDEEHSLPKNRAGDLPRDEARQFFSAHAARLLNQDKSRLDDDEKRVIDQRKRNIRAGHDLYKALQRTALGLAPAPPKTRTRDRAPGL